MLYVVFCRCFVYFNWSASRFSIGDFIAVPGFSALCQPRLAFPLLLAQTFRPVRPLTKSRVNHSIVPCFLQISQHGIQDRQEPRLNPASTPHIAYSSSIHYWRTAFGLYCESYKIMEAPMWVHNRAGCAFEISDANEFPLCMQLLSSWLRPSWPSSL